MKKNMIVKCIEENKKVVHSFGVKKLILVGSQAEGTAREDSDIDFIVEFESGRGSFDDFVYLRQFLEDSLGSRVDIGEKSYIREELINSMLGGEYVETRI